MGASPRADITHLNCWAHVRRYFVKAEEKHDPSHIDNNLADGARQRGDGEARKEVEGEEARAPFGRADEQNALRPIKLGAKNWLFIGHENAGPRAVSMFILAENCRMPGINPEVYFIDVLSRVDDHPMARIHELTPHGWAQSKNS